MNPNHPLPPNLPHLTHPPETELDWAQALINLARYLRTPEGCPWDREQSAADFAGHAAGELDELLEALRSGDAKHAEEEFGDVFFTLLASAAAAESQGLFSLENALQRAHEKMVRRHEHVFGNEKAQTPEDAIRIWNQVKAREKRNTQS